jgi:hypothetical protein
MKPATKPAKTSKTKAKVTSLAGQTAAIQAAQQPLIRPPKHIHLRDGDMPFWNSVVCARPRESWNDADLEIAANLARTKADIERIQQELDEEGDTLVNERGTVHTNPKHNILEVLSRRAVALSRITHVHTAATHGPSQDQVPKVTAAKKAEEQVSRTVGDSLIPTLRAVK